MKLSCVLALTLVTLLLAGGCSTASSAAKGPAIPVVEVARVEQRDVPIYGEWIGTLDGVVNAEIKAQVSGYLMKQDYTEGSFVTKGQLLFEIDPRPFQAAVDQANGQLAQAHGQLAQANAQLAQAEAQVAVAEANQRKAQLDEDRYIPLAKEQAVTQQDVDNAVQNNVSAKAQVQAAKATVATARAQIQAANALVQSTQAAVESAQLNLGFTRLRSLIDGIAGAAQQQVGTLVSPTSGAVTTVSTVDPIKVYFTVSEQEYLDFHRRYSTESTLDAARKQLRLELILADGTTYGQTGSFFFADRSVNEGTGAIRIAGLFSNPGNTLRPGQYAKVRVVIRTRPGALLVPQRAVSELQGSYQVAIVDDEGKVSMRPVTVGERTGSMWIINAGVRPGELVVAEGVQKVRPGSPVRTKPFTPAAEQTKGV